MQFGELIVTGKDKVEIELGHRHPENITVKFKDTHVIIPCNPRHHDSLHFELKSKINHNKEHSMLYCLVIQWHVTDIRTIKWLVCY